MTAYRAVPGGEIRKGMVVILKPGAKPFEVSRVEDAGLVSDHWVYLYDTDGNLPAGGATYTEHWFAEVVSS